MIKIKKIAERGSTVGVFSPSEPISEYRRAKFEAGISILKQNGFNCILSDNCFKSDFYHAGSVEERISDINKLLDDPNVDFLISSWGGKSCNQLVKHLDFDKISFHRKAITGFSDPCVISNYITQKTGLYTFYGPNVLGKLNETDHHSFKILKVENYDVNIFGNVNSIPCRCINRGVSEGRLIGGNLSTFLLGFVCSDVDINYFKDKILFWEDAGNPPQIIDQYLRALENKGIFNLISGMIIGDFVYEDSQSWKNKDHFKLINEIFKNYNFPIAYIPSFGHQKLENPIIPIGASGVFNAEEFTFFMNENIIE
ncbi:MAG: LD-carboxypeptidase [Bacteroidales bacterium]|nr:LD-carboxypeptidase [Bacteroidales bacterium]